jgi:Fe2+ or Zn2+ uptake regulation protein
MSNHVFEHHGFKVDTHKITICGVCEKCAEA